MSCAGLLTRAEDGSPVNQLRKLLVDLAPPRLASQSGNHPLAMPLPAGLNADQHAAVQR